MKKFIALLFIGMLTLSAIGCSKSSDTATPDDGAGQTEEPAGDAAAE